MTQLNALTYDPLLKQALEEDLGRAGDLTSLAVIPANAKTSLNLNTRQDGCIAGLDISLRAFTILDPSISVKTFVKDGDFVPAGTILATISGNARSILSAERTCLNLLSHLSGIATKTYEMAQLIADLPTKLVDTRKTLPGLRALQKHAVKMGGGYNHRFALDDAIMIKDNHIAVAGDIVEAVKRARDYVGHTVKIEVEVDRLEQLEQLLTTDADIVLLDNMTPQTLKQAVEMVNGRMICEASGNISAQTIRAVSKTGVDIISAGCLTHTVKKLDIWLDERKQTELKSVATRYGTNNL